MSSKELSKKIEHFPSLLDDFFKPWNEWFNGNHLSRYMTVPAANIIDKSDQYQLSLAAPGLKKSDFNIDVNGNLLTVSCEKEDKKEEKDNHHTRREYNYSAFSRSFTIPEDVAKDKIEASYEDGVLKVQLPKKEEVQKSAISKHIQVR